MNMEIEKKIAPIQTALDNKDKIQFYIELGSCLMIMRMHIQCDDNIYLTVAKQESRYSEIFDVFDHLKFLNSIENYIKYNGFYSYNGSVCDIGLSILVILSDHKLYIKFIDAIRAKYDEIRIKVLEKIGIPFDPLYTDRFSATRDNFLQYYSDNIEVLEKDILNYIPDSERWKEAYEEICDNKKLRDIILELIEKSND